MEVVDGAPRFQVLEGGVGVAGVGFSTDDYFCMTVKEGVLQRNGEEAGIAARDLYASVGGGAVEGVFGVRYAPLTTEGEGF